MLAENSLRFRRYEPRSTMLPHMHQQASLTLVIGGDYLERIGPTERHYGTGIAAFHPAEMIHAQEFGTAGARQIIIEPQQDWLACLADTLNLTDAPYSSLSELHHLGGRLVQELSNDDEFSCLAREGLVLEMLAAFARLSDMRSPKPPVWLENARDFIHGNACGPLSIAQIAKAAGRHEIHLAREFRRYFGSSIGSYVRKLRTEEAARLLSQTREDITEIALRCGFASHAHLCRVFRAHYGTTPSQYRGRHPL
jgi:AraC family transcriptional regulator